MERSVLRVKLTSYTASFRHPGLIAGYQPTLPLPPLSTIYGLISAAKGSIVTPNDTFVGFLFFSEGKGTDLETIIKDKKGKVATDIIKREFLAKITLYLYIDLNFKKFFKKPYYQLLLGRSSDIAFVEDICEVKLVKKSNVRVGHTILTNIPSECRTAMIKALPTYFVDVVPRKAVGTRRYVLVDDFFITSQDVWYDEESEWGIIIYDSENLNLHIKN